MCLLIWRCKFFWFDTGENPVQRRPHSGVRLLFFWLTNIFTGLVSRIPSSSPNRKGHTCASLNGELYISGGTSTFTDRMLDSVEVLNLETLKWRNISSMNIPCSSHTMENVNGELTVFGGGSLRPLDSLENLIGNSWQLEEMK